MQPADLIADALSRGVALAFDPPRGERDRGLYVVEAYRHAQHGGARAKKVLRAAELSRLAEAVAQVVAEVSGDAGDCDLV